MLENILSDLAVAIVLLVPPILFGIGLSVIPAQRQKRRMFRFFGIQPKTPDFSVYLSVVNVIKPFTTATFRWDAKQQQNIVGAYVGPAIPESELLALSRLADILQVDPLQNFPPSIRDKLTARFDQFKPIRLRLGSSPLRPLPFPDFEYSSLLCVGSQTYNSVTDYYMNYHSGYLQITSSDNRPCIEVLKGERKGRKFYPSAQEGDGYLGMLERLVDDEHGNTVFIAAGVGAAGTIGAVMYLMYGWGELARKYQNRPFAFAFELDPHNVTDRKELKGLKFLQQEWFPTDPWIAS
jgi:hypothetical protein